MSCFTKAGNISLLKKIKPHSIVCCFFFISISMNITVTVVWGTMFFKQQTEIRTWNIFMSAVISTIVDCGYVDCLNCSKLMWKQYASSPDKNWKCLYIRNKVKHYNLKHVSLRKLVILFTTFSYKTHSCVNTDAYRKTTQQSQPLSFAYLVTCFYVVCDGLSWTYFFFQN